METQTLKGLKMSNASKLVPAAFLGVHVQGVQIEASLDSVLDFVDNYFGWGAKFLNELSIEDHCEGTSFSVGIGLDDDESIFELRIAVRTRKAEEDLKALFRELEGIKRFSKDGSNWVAAMPPRFKFKVVIG